MDSYRCDKVIPCNTLAVTISDTVEYRHNQLTMPSVTPADRILHGLHSLTGALADVPTACCDAQLKAISNLRNACSQWQANSPVQDPVGPAASATKTMSPANVRHSLRLQAQAQPLEASPRPETPVQKILPSHQDFQPAPRVQKVTWGNLTTITPQPTPRVAIKTPPLSHEPITSRTRSKVPEVLEPIAQLKRLHANATPQGKYSVVTVNAY